jgi:hypothetical protein
VIPNLRLLAFGAAVAATLFAGWKLTELVSAARVVKAAETINQEGRDAADAIAEARQRVRACHQSGRMWDRATGQCGAAVPGAGK